ncbi:MAG TPA: NifB/NifX family molybdenum-iron cluster-binding protein [bacterium]|nr:NifB/NifX family molybdenum-iron cluster-binding protein [bacterium]
MKIAISSTSEKIDGQIDETFGRCPCFIMVEIKDNKVDKIEILKNDTTDQASGAGISAAQLMAENNVNAVITNNVGPRALDVLNQFNIEIYSGEGIVKDVLRAFIDKKLKKIN